MAKVSRREFVVAATALATLGGGQAASPAQAQTAEGNAAPQSAAEVEARIAWILKKYGARLNDEQRADIRRIIISGQAGIEAMRAFPLDNSVAPATRFRVRRWQK